MGNSNGIISTDLSGISIGGDISEVLQEQSLDLGTLCKSDKVNMWSKNKPIKYASWTGKGTGQADSDGNPYGIYRPSGDSLPSVAASPIYWVKPTGGSSSPYRALDFDGYNHDCECPWNILLPESPFPKGITGAVVKFLDSGQAVPTGNVSINDLYSGKYFCVCIESGQSLYYKTLASGASTLNISACPAYTQTAAGSSITISCGMSSKQIGDPTNYQDWVSAGIDATFYSLSYPGHTYSVPIQLADAVVPGFTLVPEFPNNLRIFNMTQVANPTSGEMAATGAWRNGMVPETGVFYTLASVTYWGIDAETGDRISEVTVPYADLPVSGTFLPTTISRVDWTETQGAPITFRCSIMNPVGGSVEWHYKMNYVLDE